MTDDFNRASASFLDWFQQQPGATFHPGLKLEDLRNRGAGRGIVATQDIPADTELFHIPRQSVLTVENSSLAKQHPDFFETAEQKLKEDAGTQMPDESDAASDDDETSTALLDPWPRLIITLLYERLLGPASPWDPYFAVFPSHFDTLMFWSEAETAELQASDVRDKVGKASADEMFRSQLLPAVRACPWVFKTELGDDEVVEMAHQVGSTIMAYAFDLESDEEEVEEDGWAEDREGQTLGMVPMADMLNADAEFNAHLNHGDDFLTMLSLRPLAPGDEILNYYGPLPNSDLLRRYGYTSRKHDVHNVAELPWPLVLGALTEHFGLKADAVAQASAALEADEDDYLEDAFVLEYEPTSPTDTGVLPSVRPEITEFPEVMREQVKAFIKAYRKASGADIKLGNHDFWTVMCVALERKLAQYGTTAEEDEAVLAALADDGAQRRKAMAVHVRWGEKALLNCARQFAEQKRYEVEGESRGKRVKTG